MVAFQNAARSAARYTTCMDSSHHKGRWLNIAQPDAISSSLIRTRRP